MPVLVHYRGTRGARLAPRVVRERAQRMLDALGLAEFELSVMLCDGAIMRGLNKRHRGADYATDVLAFETDAALRGTTRLLGDIVLCIPTATRQARKAGKDAVSEVTMLLAHGLLHLLGLDHRDRTERRRMWARTDLLIAAALSRGHARLRTGGGKRSEPRLQETRRTRATPPARRS